MSYAHILQWSSLMINIHSAKLIQCVKPFNYVAKDCMFTVQIFDVIRQGDEELAAAAAQSPPVWRRRNGHRNSPFMFVLQPGKQLRHEVPWRTVRLWKSRCGCDIRGRTLSTSACGSWISGLCYKVFRDLMNSTRQKRLTMLPRDTPLKNAFRL